MADSGLQLKIIKANAISLIAKSQKVVIHLFHHRIEISCLKCKLWLRKKLSSGTHASFLITLGKFQICAIIKMFVNTFRAYDRRINEFPWRSLLFIHLTKAKVGKSEEMINLQRDAREKGNHRDDERMKIFPLMLSSLCISLSVIFRIKAGFINKLCHIFISI